MEKHALFVARPITRTLVPLGSATLRIEGERSCRAFLKITSAMSEGRTFEAGMLRAGRQPTGLGRSCPVCTENLSSGVVMVKSTEDGVRFDTSDSLNFASDAVDAWRTPKRIFDAHPADQYAQLRVDLRSPSLGARLPTPVTAKAGPVPTHERLRPDDCENLRIDGNQRYSWIKNQRSWFVSRTRPGSLRLTTFN
jgi:hypothetical protein